MNPLLLGAALLIAQPANDSSALIDRELAVRWKTEKLTPADRTSDLEFQRRVYIDLIGRIPTLTEQEAYQKDAPAKRRALLVERLLRHDDYAHHWAGVWTDLLLSGVTDREPRLAFQAWLLQHFAKNGSHKEMVEKLLLAKGKPQDAPAVHYFLAHRGLPLRKDERERLGQYEMFPLTAHVFRTLHAKRVQCVQCHDHPFDDDLRQADFHQMNLLFRQVGYKLEQKKPRVESIDDDATLNKNGLAPFERRNGLMLFGQPRFYGDVWKNNGKQTRREFFTERFVKHPDFARGHVNLLWTHFFGHSLNETADWDDMFPFNKLVHPKILERLASDFVKSGHDSRVVMRAICLSDAYGLKSVVNPTNMALDKVVYASRLQSRPLSQGALLESLIVAIAGEDYVKRRSALREAFTSGYQLVAPPEVQHCEVTPLVPDNELSLNRALWVINNEAIQRESNAANGPVARALKKAGGGSKDAVTRIVQELFQTTYCRPPTQRELEHLNNPRTYQFRAGTAKSEGAFWRGYAEDIFWAILNSNEFCLHH